MDAVFLKLVNMSLTAGWLILAVFALRLVGYGGTAARFSLFH